RLGKRENCQVGVFMAYATSKGHGPLDRRLFLPEDWAEDRRPSPSGERENAGPRIFR
ncbi:MAG: transposase, partial [Planctomycetota bacterium]